MILVARDWDHRPSYYIDTERERELTVGVWRLGVWKSCRVYVRVSAVWLQGVAIVIVVGKHKLRASEVVHTHTHSLYLFLFVVGAETIKFVHFLWRSAVYDKYIFYQITIFCPLKSYVSNNPCAGIKTTWKVVNLCDKNGKSNHKTLSLRILFTVQTRHTHTPSHRHTIFTLFYSNLIMPPCEKNLFSTHSPPTHTRKHLRMSVFVGAL